MEDGFFEQWGEAALTSLGFFWKALWAFVLGYVVSSMIQVFVTRQRMRRTMGDAGARSVGLGAFFGFVSSSCSFAALATTRAFIQKGAGLVPALAFLLASTNLVIELGIVIAIFLGWQFVVGEYVGGLLLILLTSVLVRVFYPKRLMEEARQRLEDQDASAGDEQDPDWRSLIRSRQGWERVAATYWSEWKMVWKDVTVGFTVAGLIATFVPESFFQTLFVGAGGSTSVLGLFEHALIGPVAAFFTFIGSMGNIPLAAVLVGSGVSFAGAMAFIFSDLVVFPVLRVNASYYGWKLALYIAGVFLVALVATALILHAGFAVLGLLPDEPTGAIAGDRFAIDYTFFLNLAFLGVTAVMGWLAWSHRQGQEVDRDGREAPAREAAQEQEVSA